MTQPHLHSGLTTARVQDSDVESTVVQSSPPVSSPSHAFLSTSPTWKNFPPGSCTEPSFDFLGYNSEPDAPVSTPAPLGTSNEDPFAPISVPDFDADSFLQNNGFDFDAMRAMPPARLTAVPAGILLVLARYSETPAAGGILG
ncbi:hypothetical protein B0H14DRAFT_3875813 [Mycena olivaceomarginata]|nr:hypothetical protein B0H14DRAFT_3875813 [Mycena olivaceomarginata]